MKKQIILFFIASYLLSFSSFAQLNKNTWLVGGSGSFSSNNSNYTSNTLVIDTKVTEVKMTPNIGYFIIDKFALGLKSTFSWIKVKAVSANTGTSNTIRFDYGPFLRYYFLEKEKPFNIMIDLAYQFGNAKFTSNVKGKRNDFSVMAGPVLYFNSSVGFEFLVGYKYASEKQTISADPLKSTIKGLQAAIGLQIHFEKL